MTLAGETKLILVRRETRLDELITRFNTKAQAKFYVEHMGAEFSDYEKEHEIYNLSIAEAQRILAGQGRVQVLDRRYLPNFIFGRDDIVVALGQDGLVANTLKYLDGQVLIGVNPDPERWDGVLLPFRVDDLARVVLEFLAGERVLKRVTMGKAVLNDGQVLHAVNDFFIGQKTHVSARYQLCSGQRSEQQSSSGIIGSTGLGSSGWLKSVLAGASGIVRALAKRAEDIKLVDDISWDMEQLFFSVREPFPSATSKAGLVFGKVTRQEPLVVRSLMAEGGVIFSDGIEQDFLSFNSGLEARITVADKVGRVVV